MKIAGLKPQTSSSCRNHWKAQTPPQPIIWSRQLLAVAKKNHSTRTEPRILSNFGNHWNPNTTTTNYLIKRAAAGIKSRILSTWASHWNPKHHPRPKNIDRDGLKSRIKGFSRDVVSTVSLLFETCFIRPFIWKAFDAQTTSITKM